MKCPLCKTENLSIMHGYDGSSFPQHHVNRDLRNSSLEEDVDIIVHHVLGDIDSFRRDEVKHSNIFPETKREELKLLVFQAVEPFLTGRSDRFVNELELFLASGLKIDAFDRVYTEHLHWKIPEISEEETDETPEHEPAVP
ncbi:Hypothetical predicted protein [Olea europaea subsp. europaea]|uniref:Uncharacterized protein n=1 Tax=Olea europaea subsp. europaea TaxID=158383 RepID=A0A8S0SNQ7_OLEEU|nr:Hypothetical predicted protein [Olea europaea subsp. europaea]